MAEQLQQYYLPNQTGSSSSSLFSDSMETAQSIPEMESSVPPSSSQPLYVQQQAVRDVIKSEMTHFDQTVNVVNGYLQSGNFLTGSAGWQIQANGDAEFNDGVFRGAITASTIDIGGSDSTSFHVDADGNMWLGAATFGAAPFSVSNTGALIATSATISGYNVVTKGTFGGNGSDGALSISSGTTTINLGSALVVTKNYTSISITGTGQLNFSNPHSGGTIIILKSQGGVTITSSTTPCVDASGMGAAGGAGVAEETNGNDGTVANDIAGADSSNGKLGANSGGTSAAAGVVYTTKGVYLVSESRLYRQMVVLSAGSGGGSGAGGAGAGTDGTGGAGGRGGAGLIIECGGALNFTTSGGISVAGANGSAGGTGPSGCGGGGGGGGAAGMCLVLYNSVTANTGTITRTGGAGGAGGNGQANSGANGGGGSGAGMYNGAGGAGGQQINIVGAGAAGSAGSNGSAGAGVSSGGAGGAAGSNLGGSIGGSGGGGGCGGEALVALNTILA